MWKSEIDKSCLERECLARDIIRVFWENIFINSLAFEVKGKQALD